MAHLRFRLAAAAFTLVSSNWASAGNHHQLSFEIKADTRELCELASDVAFDDIEAKLNERSSAPIFAKYVTVCQQSPWGGYKKTVTFRQLAQ